MGGEEHTGRGLLSAAYNMGKLRQFTQGHTVGMEPGIPGARRPGPDLGADMDWVLDCGQVPNSSSSVQRGQSWPRWVIVRVSCAGTRHGVGQLLSAQTLPRSESHDRTGHREVRVEEETWVVFKTTERWS